MSPKKYVEQFGASSLKSARRGGKTPILLGLARIGRAGKPTRKIKGGVLGSSGRMQWIPMFVGASAATIEARFNTTDAMERAAERMPEFYKQNREKYEGR